jgi:uncharacterized phage-like protein YoqJ
MDEPACAFVGHHPMRFDFGYNEEEPLCVMIKEAMKSKILALYQCGVKAFYTDCELLVGLWAGELVLELMEKKPDEHDLYLCCVMPYEEQPRKWPECFRNRYFALIENSSYNELISAQETDKCHQQCGRYLIDHAENVIAVYDNGNVTRMENAAYTLSYAKRKGRQIIYINPDTAEIITGTTKSK